MFLNMQEIKRSSNNTVLPDFFICLELMMSNI